MGHMYEAPTNVVFIPFDQHLRGGSVFDLREENTRW